MSFHGSLYPSQPLSILLSTYLYLPFPLLFTFSGKFDGFQDSTLVTGYEICNNVIS